MSTIAAMRGRLAAAALVGALMMATPLRAQDAVTGQVWTDFLLDWYVRGDHLVEFELGPKVLFSGGQRWAELTLTPAYEYVVGHYFELVARTLFSLVRQNNTLSTFEIRPIIGFRLYILSASSHRVMVRDFNRVESRNIRYDDTDDWESTWRYRNRLEAQIAINHAHLADDHTLYLLTDAELFVNLGRAAEERFNDNWRFRAGLGYRIKYEWRIELLYTAQLSRDTLLSDFEQTNHIMRLRIKFYPKASLFETIAAKRNRN